MDFHDKSVLCGTCNLMCPEQEIKIREERELLHPFELDNARRRVDREKAVKEYSRPAAGKIDPDPSDLRPAPVLLRTVKYLITTIVPQTQWRWHYVYEFVFDRLRAVRQDMTIQRIHGSYAVYILERIIRVMIYAHYRLCEAAPAQFDAKINGTHIQECLKRLLCLYQEQEACICHQGEFTAMYLMFNLGSPEALRFGLNQKQVLSGCGTFMLALSISLTWWRRNYVRVFRLVRLLPVLHMCAFNNVKHILLREALLTMSSGYNSKALSYPLSDLCTLMDLDDTAAAHDLCQTCGLDVTSDNRVKFLKTSFKANSQVVARRQRLVDQDLEWEDVSLLLIGPECFCGSGGVT